MMSFARMPHTIFRTLPVLAILLAVVSPSVASAATSTWTGGGGNNSWSPQANWGTSTLPTTTGTYSLQFGGTTRTATINNIGTVSVNSLSFTNTGGTGQNSFFQISSGTVVLNNASIVTTTATGGVFTNNSNGDTISSAMTLSGTSTFTTADLHNLSLLGTMSGSGAVIFAQATPGATDYVYLGGTNTYSGGTVIQGGYVQTGARTGFPTSTNSAFGSGSVTIRDTGTLLVRNNSVITNDITVSGTGANGSAVMGSFSTAGSTAEVQGPMTLAGSVQFATASSAAADNASKLVLSGPIDLGANTLTLRSGVRSGETTGLLIQVTGTVSGSGGVVVNGTAGGSRVLMSGNNSYSGGTTISTGVLAVGSSTALGTGFLAITPSGTGDFDLSGQALQVGALSGNSSAVIRSSTSGNASLTTTSTSNSTYAGTIQNGSGSAVVGLTKAGSGILTLSGSNSNTGRTDVNGGVLALGSASALAGGGVITFGGGTLQYSANNTQDYSSRITTSGSAIAIDTNGQTVTFAAAIDSSNTGGLMKQGAGTLFLNGVNTYTGNTDIVSGTLGGNGTIAGLVSVGTNAFISPGSAAGTTGVLSVRSLDLNLGGTALMSISGTGAGLYDQIAALGSVELNGALNIQFAQNDFQSADFWQLFSSGSGASGFSGHLGSVTATGAYGELSFSYLGSGEWKATGGLLAVDESLLFYENNSHALGETFLAGQLVLVPEPSTFVIAGIGIVVAGWQSLSRRPRLALLRQHTIPAARRPSPPTRSSKRSMRGSNW